jgi:hypothetical protein
MPRVRRNDFPPRLFVHLLERIEQRKISVEQLTLLSDWLATEPEVPGEKWFKEFSGMTVCGEGELIKTFLVPGQIATGKKIS